MSVKAIPTTSRAKTKEERKSLRRAVLDHGSTDADAIEDKRQHSALQLIKLGETVNKLGRQRILMEEQGEKRIAEMREEFKVKRAVHEKNANCTAEWLKQWDAKAEATLEAESFQLSALIADSELRTSGLSAQIMLIDAVNMLVDCVSLREIVREDGTKHHIRTTIAAVDSDILLGVDQMNDKIDEIAKGISEVVQGMKQEEGTEQPTVNKPIPTPPAGVKA